MVISWCALLELYYTISPAGALVWTVMFRLRRVYFDHRRGRCGINPWDWFSDNVGWGDNVPVQENMFSIIIVGCLLSTSREFA